MFTLRWIGGLLVTLILAHALQHFGPHHARPLTDATMALRLYAADDPNSSAE